MISLITTTGMRNLGINSAYAKTRGIIVSGTGQGGNSTLEHIWALILGTVRYIALEDANVKAANPQWQTFIPLGLSGHTLGLIGVGNLGSKTANVGVVSLFVVCIALILIHKDSESIWYASYWVVPELHSRESRSCWG